MADESGASNGSGSKPSTFTLWFPPVLLAVLIAGLSSTPGRQFPGHPDFLNNVAHFTEFALLGFFLARAFYGGRPAASPGFLVLTFAVCVFFGFLDELHQFFVPERVFDLVDLAFDAAGALAGSMLFMSLGSRNKVHGNPPE